MKSFNYFLLSFFLLLSMINLVNLKKKKKQKPKIFNIPSILEWAKTNNIYINPNLTLNKNGNDKTFYYFTTNKVIPTDTVLLSMPYNMSINQNILDTHFKEIHDKKYEKLWDFIVKKENPYLKYFTTKQLMYMSLIVENAFTKKKGFLFEKYEPYFSLYDDINLDNFPVFYDENEKYYLRGASFGNLIQRASESLSEEYHIIEKELEFKSVTEEDYLKYRILVLSNSVDFNNSNIKLEPGFNDTIVIPFIDCFNKVIATNKSDAYFRIRGEPTDKLLNENSNKTYTDYYFEIITNKEINPNSEINLQWRMFSNADSLLYYGYVEKNNPIKPKFYVDLFNRRFQHDLGLDNKTFSLQRTLYEINLDFYDPTVINSYRTLAEQVQKYKNREEGPYEMMADNLKYYLDLYDYPLDDGTIHQYIMKKKNIENIKEVLHLEKKIVQKKVERLTEIIKGIKDRKFQADDLDEKTDEKANETKTEDL